MLFLSFHAPTLLFSILFSHLSFFNFCNITNNITTFHSQLKNKQQYTQYCWIIKSTPKIRINCMANEPSLGYIAILQNVVILFQAVTTPFLYETLGKKFNMMSASSNSSHFCILLQLHEINCI
jgi:hypothetical protein